MRLIDADELTKRLQEKARSIEEHSTNEQQKCDTINGLMGAVNIVYEMPTFEKDCGDIPYIEVIAEFSPIESSYNDLNTKNSIDFGRFCISLVNKISYIFDTQDTYNDCTDKLHTTNYYEDEYYEYEREYYDSDDGTRFLITFKSPIAGYYGMYDLEHEGITELDCIYVKSYDGRSCTKPSVSKFDSYEAASDYILSTVNNFENL